LFEPPLFKFEWGKISQGGMPPPAIVESLDIFKDRRTETPASWPGVPVKQLCLQRGVEAFSDSVVQGVTNRAHGAEYAGILQPATKD